MSAAPRLCSSRYFGASVFEVPKQASDAPWLGTRHGVATFDAGLRRAMEKANEQMRHGCRNCWVLAAFHFSTPPDDPRTTSARSALH